MSGIAVFLITLSAFSHALWNLLGKKRNPSVAFYLCTCISSAVLLSPALIVYREGLTKLPTPFWNLVLGTGLAQALYFVGLAGAYRRGALSLVYPVARALPVLLVAGYNIWIGKGHEISAIALTGMVLISCGCILVPMKNFADLRIGNYINLRGLFILATALGTTAYTIIDDQGLKILREDPSTFLSAGEAALVYIALQTAMTVPFLFFATLCSTAKRKRTITIIRKDFLYAAMTGIIVSGTYLLVLASMAFVENVSYVAAFRQLSIPLAAIFGVLLLKESAYRTKNIGIALLMSGLLMVMMK